MVVNADRNAALSMGRTASLHGSFSGRWINDGLNLANGVGRKTAAHRVLADQFGIWRDINAEELLGSIKAMPERFKGNDQVTHRGGRCAQFALQALEQDGIAQRG